VAGKGFCESPDFAAVFEMDSGVKSKLGVACATRIAGARSRPAVGTKKRIKVSVT